MCELIASAWFILRETGERIECFCWLCYEAVAPLLLVMLYSSSATHGGDDVVPLMLVMLYKSSATYAVDAP